MKILALDTSSKYLCLGIVNGERMFEYVLDTGVALSRVLVPTIGRALCAAGMQPRDIEHYVLGLGPGSFTALRIGHAAVKAMAWANARKIAGVSTLEAVASHPAIPDGLIVPVIDARRAMLYCGWFSKTAGCVRRIKADELLGYDAFIRRLARMRASRASKKIIIGGDGSEICSSRIRASFPNAVIIDKELWHPHPQPLIALGMRLIQAHKSAHPFRIGPEYLHPQECQVRNRSTTRDRGKK